MPHWNNILAFSICLEQRPMIQEEVWAMLSSIHNQYVASSSHPDRDGDNNNLIIRDMLQKCTNNIIARMAFGKIMDEITTSSKQHSETFAELLVKVSEAGSELNISDLIPCLAWLDLQVSFF